MNPIQEVSLAYEMHLFISDGWTLEEARIEIKALLETTYKKEVLAEVDEEICYGWNEALSDIIGSIERIMNNMNDYANTFNEEDEEELPELTEEDILEWQGFYN
jgi:hypothetical protein